MPHNFKTTPFTGTLLQLFEECANQGPKNDYLMAGNRWVMRQLETQRLPNLLPVRKHAKEYEVANNQRVDMRLRGSTVTYRVNSQDHQFIAVDNEPLAYFFKMLTNGAPDQGNTFRSLIEGRIMPVSWHCDVNPRPAYRFSGVSTYFRDHGLKLAHIIDAGDDADNLALRYLRSMMPANLFLFPNSNVVRFELSRGGARITHKIWSEDQLIRSLALSFIVNRLNKCDVAKNFFADHKAQLKTYSDWEKQAEDIRIEVTPRNAAAKNPIPPTAPAVWQQREPVADQNVNAMARVPRDMPRSLDECVAELKKWRRDFPNATQLDGKDGNNPQPWYHVKIEGFHDGVDDYDDQDTGVGFKGSVYNGVWCFHGDARVVAIDRFLELADVADNVRDVLTSFVTQPRNDHQRPKLAIKGYDDEVDGFYLYKVDAERRAIRRAG